MTVTEQLDSWRSVIESRDLDLEETDAPDDSSDEWFQVLARFTRRGFLRVILSPQDDALALHVQVAVPGAEDGYAQSLKRHLNSLSGTEWDAVLEDRPWVLDAKALPEEKLTDVLDTFELVADHIRRAEAEEEPSELAREFAGAGEPDLADASPHEAREQEEQEQTGGSVFESIGTGETGKETPSSDVETGDAVLDRFQVRVANGTVRAELELVAQLGERAEKQLLSALARTLRARFDVKLLARSLDEKDGKPVVKLALEPASLGAVDETSLGDLSHDLGRYFERLKKFNKMGLSLLDVLSPGATSSSSEREPAEPSKRRSERRDEADRDDEANDQARVRRRDDHRRAESEESGVVFSFGGAQLDDAGSDVVQAGDFTDPRVKREDASTPLVDVALRHPGYSDKSMRQVLSILLDVDYFEAGKLIGQAPCVIAWGISQERAREFKRVIEGAGGRVTLVEPDSLSS